LRKTRSEAFVLAFALIFSLTACGAATGQAGAGSKAKKAEQGGATGAEKVATIGSEVITRAELEEYMQQANPKAIQDYYEAQRQALGGLINTKLMDAEAARQGITSDELQQKLIATAAPVDDGAVVNFYNANQNRMGLKSLDEMRPQIKAYLENQNRQQALASFIQEQNKSAGVVVHMEPPRVEVAVAATDPYKGPVGAAITIVEFSDFQ
jgi:hypothetical protein